MFQTLDTRSMFTNELRVDYKIVAKEVVLWVVEGNGTVEEEKW